MDKQQLIESGLLELYALGAANSEEISAVEKLLHHSEVKHALSEIEHRLEQTGLENAINPPGVVRQDVMNAITSKQKNVSGSISLLERQLEKWRRNFMVAASIAGLFAIGFGWQIYNSSISDDTEQLQARLTELELEIEKLGSSNSVITDQLAYINHTYTTPIVLKATPASPGSKAVVYWNPKVDEALLSTNGLPDLPEGKVYQIWADIEGEMISMKVFTIDQKLVLVFKVIKLS